jgi:hypothetical protein
MIEYLEKLDNKTLAEFWCYFNRWEYPRELDRFKPNNWDLLPTQIKYKINKPIINYIKNRVSEKELLREWNKERMVGIDFDIWWENKEPISDFAKTLLKEMYKLENSNLN